MSQKFALQHCGFVRDQYLDLEQKIRRQIYLVDKLAKHTWTRSAATEKEDPHNKQSVVHEPRAQHSAP